MDHNGLSDPYVKLHLLPGASKVSAMLIHEICAGFLFFSFDLVLPGSLSFKEYIYFLWTSFCGFLRACE